EFLDTVTSKEYELLLYLDDNKGQPVSREEALRNVWEFGFAGDTNVVDVYIRYLRRKLDERFDAKFIVTVRNKGYMLR
ncbi:MAG: winged helix-turn-helix transcriptional regulator, partial [Clostridia bacterium]|nr:winged helix-turn-helix transcriptional regulator [Clostridia bacterium]